MVVFAVTTVRMSAVVAYNKEDPMQLDEARPATHIHARILWVCVFAILVTTGIAIGIRLIEVWPGINPYVLASLSTSLDHTIILASELTFWWFMTIGTVRRLIIDPFWYVMGWIGVEGLRESRFQLIRDIAGIADKKDMNGRRNWTPRWLRRFGTWGLAEAEKRLGANVLLLIWHAVTADGITSFLLGRRRVNPFLVASVNLPFTILWVYWFNKAGVALEPYLHYVRAISWGITASIIAVATIRFRNRLIAIGKLIWMYHFLWVCRWWQLIWQVGRIF